LDPAQARRFIELIADTRDEAMYLTALAVGLRQGELLGLSWRDIDLEASTLIVRNALQRVDGRMALVEPKSLTSRRTVVLPALVVGSLRRHRRRQMEERLVAGTRYGVDDWDLIFRTRIGSPMDGPTVNKRFQELLARNDLPRQRFHDLRHACASLLLAQGVAPRVVMETLGHSQISLTMNTYSHVIPALGRAAADRMDDILAVR
jgi:integrase